MLLSLASSNYVTVILLPPGWDAVSHKFAVSQAFTWMGLNPDSSIQIPASWTKRQDWLARSQLLENDKAPQWKQMENIPWESLETSRYLHEFNLLFDSYIEGEKGNKNRQLPVLIFSFNWKKNLGLIPVGTICAFLIEFVYCLSLPAWWSLHREASNTHH